jgi:hypothetical protein
MIKLAQVVIKTPRDVYDWHVSQVAHHMEAIKKMNSDPRVKDGNKLLQKHLDQVQFHQSIANVLQATL